MTTSRARFMLPLVVSLPLVMAATVTLLDRTSEAAAPACEPAASGQAIDPKAMAVLSRTTTYLRALPAFAVHAYATRDEVVDRDFKVQRATTEDILVRRPDHLRIEGSHDKGTRRVFYDGERLAVSSSPENYYTTVRAPATIVELVDDAKKRYDVEFPLADLLYVSMGGELRPDIQHARYMGPSKVGDVDCDLIALRTKAADMQLWVDRGASPLPRKIVVTSKNEPTDPQFSAVLTWDLSPKVEDSAFAFVPPAGAARIPFATVDVPNK